LRSAEWSAVKKHVRRWGGKEVGWDVSAFRSHCITEMLKRHGGRAGGRDLDSQIRVGREKEEGRGGLAPGGTVEASRSKAKALPDVL
jgi:hypothetical protein